MPPGRAPARAALFVINRRISEMWLLQALNLRLKTHPISGLDQAGKVRQPTFPFKSSSRSVLRPDTALMLECVPRSKSSDCNRSAPVVSCFSELCLAITSPNDQDRQRLFFSRESVGVARQYCGQVGKQDN